MNRQMSSSPLTSLTTGRMLLDTAFAPSQGTGAEQTLPHKYATGAAGATKQQQLQPRRGSSSSSYSAATPQQQQELPHDPWLEEHDPWLEVLQPPPTSPPLQPQQQLQALLPPPLLPSPPPPQQQQEHDPWLELLQQHQAQHHSCTTMRLLVQCAAVAGFPRPSAATTAAAAAAAVAVVSAATAATAAALGLSVTAGPMCAGAPTAATAAALGLSVTAGPKCAGAAQSVRQPSDAANPTVQDVQLQPQQSTLALQSTHHPSTATIPEGFVQDVQLQPQQSTLALRNPSTATIPEGGALGNPEAVLAQLVPFTEAQAFHCLGWAPTTSGCSREPQGQPRYVNLAVDRFLLGLPLRHRRAQVRSRRFHTSMPQAAANLVWLNALPCTRILLQTAGGPSRWQSLALEAAQEFSLATTPQGGDARAL